LTAILAYGLCRRELTPTGAKSCEFKIWRDQSFL
jgi:hypothetical protein